MQTNGAYDEFWDIGYSQQGKDYLFLCVSLIINLVVFCAVEKSSISLQKI